MSSHLKSPLLRLLTALLAGLVAAATVEAAGLGISPVTAEFAANETVKGIQLNNSSQAVVRAQVRVYVWTQDGGEDRLLPSKALVVSPPMLSLEPGQEQLLRVIRTGPVDAADAVREQSYRLLIDELPDPAAPPRAGLNFVMQYSVPVFVAAAAPMARPAQPLSWWIEAQSLRLRTRNDGVQHAQIADFELLDAQGRVLASHPGLMGYVLPGATRHWQLSLPAEAKAAGLEIRARIDGQTVRQQLQPGNGGAR